MDILDILPVIDLFSEIDEPAIFNWIYLLNKIKKIVVNFVITAVHTATSIPRNNQSKPINCDAGVASPLV